MLKALLALLLAGAALAAPGKQTFTGIISDNMCLQSGHASMRMGPTDAECAVACHDAHGAPYVLVAGTTVYELSDQRMPEGFAGRTVRLAGVLDAKTKTIAVDSIVLAPSSK